MLEGIPGGGVRKGGLGVGAERAACPRAPKRYRCARRCPWMNAGLCEIQLAPKRPNNDESVPRLLAQGSLQRSSHACGSAVAIYTGRHGAATG